MTIYLLSLLFPFSSHATCTPTPDCASIGYTETSCEGEGLKCPFDISKMKCMPCDSSFRYTCDGENVASAVGSACGGKYASCTCSSTDYIFFNGFCICDTSCTVGAIYYSDKTCSSCLDTSKTPIGVVVKDNELVISQIRSTDMAWGKVGVDIEDLPNYTTISDAKTDFNGKENSSIIVASHTSLGLNSSNSAAIYCNEYSTDRTNAGNWYLPATGELSSYVYNNRSKINTTMRKLNWTFGAWLWSSTECNATITWIVNPNTGITSYNKSYTKSVSCFLEI